MVDWSFVADASLFFGVRSSLKGTAVGLALFDYENLDFRMRGQQLAQFFELEICFLWNFAGQNFCMTQIEELYANPTSEVSHDQIQNILKESAPLLLAPVLIGDLSEVDSMSMRHSDHFFECTQNDFEAI